jgi:alkylation response protein AidB-like acyl-CoA dehydrogenase
VWGGLGITWECPAHLFQRRALLTRRLFGDEAHHLDVLAGQLLRPQPANGEPAEDLGSPVGGGR